MACRRVRCLGVHRATENRWFELQSFLLRSIQALKLEKSLESLKKLSLPHVKVIRQNQLQEINVNDLTIGDLVCIETGDIISGDGRLLEANHLQVNESHLTGEVESIDKSVEIIK